MLVTINTDDPGLFGIDLSHELEVSQKELDFGDEDLRAVTENAIAASFLPESVKKDTRRKHFRWLSGG